VNSTCDVYLDELQDSLSAICNANVSKSTIWRILKRSGYKMKKVYFAHPSSGVNKVLILLWQITRNAAERSVQKSILCPRAKANNSSLLMFSTYLEASRYSILPAMSLDGIIAVDIVEGSFNKIRFARFVDGLLEQMNPYPRDNSVIVMDNCRIHKCPEVLDMITDR
ncbi:hypothetical protein M413DRAFT_78107, partial [Hebeloma cylindrosporum]